MVPDTDGGRQVTDPVQNPSEEDLSRWHRTFAPRAFNSTWDYLDAAELTREQEEEMLAATFAQKYHWSAVGDARTWAVADWQVSRVLAVMGYAELSRRFGERSLEIAQEHDLDPFVKGFAHEAIARAAADVDDIDTFTEHVAAARAQAAEIEDPKDRDVLEADLAEMSER